MKTKFILPSGAALLVLGMAGMAWVGGGKHTVPAHNVKIGGSSGLRQGRPGSEPHAGNQVRDLLQAALAESNSEHRKELLRQWADSMDPGDIEHWLEQADSAVNQEMRSEVRQVLLSCWTKKDMAGMAAWFGERQAADEMHQESRDILLKVLGAQEPSQAFSWMEKTLSESVRRELYGPFFRQWTAGNPSAAAAKLRQMAAASPEDAVWGELAGQLAGQWAQTDVNGAVAWAQALPKGAAKAQALVQVSYRWAEVDPKAAAACAARQDDLALLQAVAITWAASDPKSAAAWALELPAGERQNSAMAGAAAVWAQKEPAKAAAYANSLPEGEARNQARVSVASMWASSDPAEAAKWVEQFAEGAVREQAFERVINAWAAADAGEASQWLQRLPEDRSRDSAVIAFCSVIEGTDPGASFAWAESISDESIRNQKLERTAAAWLKESPAEARQYIAQSKLLPGDIKQQLLAAAAPGSP
jgi:hypothetical protein